jgi:NAD(P)-dependent dehydrogenase (short-subunit alcohol dehydrogenase family)
MKKFLEKKVIVTGASQGLGYKIAYEFVRNGADIMICARNKKLLQDAHAKLVKLSSNNQKILFQELDVSNKMDVKFLVKETIQQLGGCHILVNNAGIYGPKGKLENINWDDWVKTIEINLYGSVLICKEIIPYFKSQKYGKIIQLSGGGATNPLPYLSAYAASKAAVVRFIETIAEELKDFRIDANSIAPGALNTKMLDEIINEGPGKVGLSFFNKAKKQKETGGTSLNFATELVLFLASSSSDGITGKLISAVWDNWKNWPKYLNELNNSDSYTLRRIVGKDRNIDWGDK